MTQPQRRTDAIESLMHEGAKLDESEAQAARLAFLERVDLEIQRDQPAVYKRWIAPVAVAAAVLLAIFAWPDGAVTYTVEGAPDDSGYVRATSLNSTNLHFSDDTTILADQGSRLRVVETSAKGARLSLEKGRLEVHVVHTDSSAWSFVAGPFEVHVTGTKFDLLWDPESEQIQLDLHEGSVEVDGYEGAGRVSLKAKQRLLGDARQRTMNVSLISGDKAEHRDIEPKHDSAPAEQVAKTIENDDVESAEPLPKVAAKKTRSETSWSSLVAKGQFQEVVKAAEKRGIAQCLASCSPADLGALADAARYTGKSSLAQDGLKALRSRFGGATKNRAGFLLARLYEGQGQMSQALSWYETSLREAPQGAYAGESLAGKMRAVLALQGREAAQVVAEQYLKRYPGGVHTVAAKKLVSP